LGVAELGTEATLFDAAAAGFVVGVCIDLLLPLLVAFFSSAFFKLSMILVIWVERERWRTSLASTSPWKEVEPPTAALSPVPPSDPPSSIFFKALAFWAS